MRPETVSSLLNAEREGDHMKYTVTTTKEPENGQIVIIKRIKNSTVGAPRYEVTVILKQNGALRGAYTFIKKGFYSGDDDLAKEALRNIREELSAEALR